MTEKSEPLILRDVVVLGHGAPNMMAKVKSQTRCVCVWSKELGLCRLYPLPYDAMKDWEIFDVMVRIPTNDHRENTFTIMDYEAKWPDVSGSLVKKGEWPKDDRPELIRRLAGDTFSKVRDGKRSFGIIKPDSLSLVLEPNKEKSQAQARLTDFSESHELDNLIMDQNDYAFLPYLHYTCKGDCTSGHPHKQKLVEWGAYMFMKKAPNDEEYCKKLTDNYAIGDPEWEHHILIGNISKYPNTYIVVKLIRFKIGKEAKATKKASLDMF